MNRYIINETTLTEIADATRALTGGHTAMTPAQMVTALGTVTPEDWVRPATWPNVDMLDLWDFDGVYLTYDLTKHESYRWIGIYCSMTDSPKTWYVERGHIVGDNIMGGTFVADETHEMTGDGYFRQALDIDDGSVQLWRVRSDCKIKTLRFVTNTDTDASNYPNSAQVCVERVGRLPWINTLVSSFSSPTSTSGSWGTYWLEHDEVHECGKNSVITSLSGTWAYCYNLKSLNVSDWDTSNWNVGSLFNMFLNCFQIKTIDLSSWDTSGWNVTNIRQMFYQCFDLKIIDIHNWDVSNWTVDDNRSMIYSCKNIKTILLPNIDYSNATYLNTLGILEKLMNFNGMALGIDQDYSSFLCLSTESLIAIIDRLPTVTNKTLTLGQTNRLKLTAEQIAVATAKGWTVA